MRALCLGALLAAVSLSSCYAGPSTDDSSFHGSRYPLGVLRPTQEHPDVGVVAGIYPAPTADDPSCCWMGQNGAFEVRVPARANTLVVTIFLPALKVFEGHQQTVDVAVESGPSKRFPVRTGINFFRMPIRVSPSERVADVALTAGYTFSPLAKKINGDSRQLSMFLKAVRSERR